MTPLLISVLFQAANLKSTCSEDNKEMDEIVKEVFGDLKQLDAATGENQGQSKKMAQERLILVSNHHRFDKLRGLLLVRKAVNIKYIRTNKATKIGSNLYFFLLVCRNQKLEPRERNEEDVRF